MRGGSRTALSHDRPERLAFYLFAFITVASGVMVISARNPVHSVLF